jgi:riboflavin biosynthesis pyrimidine reductase
MLWGRVTYDDDGEHWPAVRPRRRGSAPGDARLGDQAGGQAEVRGVVTEWTSRGTNSHRIDGDLAAGVRKLKDETPAGVLLGSGKLATELDRLDLIDEYLFLVHPRIAGHGPDCTRTGYPPRGGSS